MGQFPTVTVQGIGQGTMLLVPRNGTTSAPVPIAAYNAAAAGIELHLNGTGLAVQGTFATTVAQAAANYVAGQYTTYSVGNGDGPKPQFNVCPESGVQFYVTADPGGSVPFRVL